MKKIYLFTLSMPILFLSTITPATTVVCPEYAKCKSTHDYSCDVPSDLFELYPKSNDVKPGIYTFESASVSGMSSKYGNAHCEYKNGSTTITFVMIGSPRINFDKLSSIWEEDSFRGLVYYTCKLSREECFFPL